MTAVSLLDECNFEAGHILRVSGRKSESSICLHSRRVSQVKQKQISETLNTACCNHLEASTSSEFVLVNKAQNEAEERLCAKSSRCPQSLPVLTQSLSCHSQKTVNFHAGAFAGVNVTINFYKK